MGASTSLGNEQGEQVRLATPSDSGMSIPTRPLDFARVPFSKNGLVHVESCCSRCNFRMVKWTGDFDDQERRHAAECQGPRPE